MNNVDEEVLPSSFRFINNVVLGDGVDAADASFRSGCSCSHGHKCQYSDCTCLADLEDNDSSDEEDMLKDKRLHSNGQVRLKKAYAYHAHGAKAGLLRSRLHASAEPLYECHRGCSCPKDCPNRVVERERVVPLQIFRTNDRGWGKYARLLWSREGNPW